MPSRKRVVRVACRPDGQRATLEGAFGRCRLCGIRDATTERVYTNAIVSICGVCAVDDTALVCGSGGCQGGHDDPTVYLQRDVSRDVEICEECLEDFGCPGCSAELNTFIDGRSLCDPCLSEAWERFANTYLDIRPCVPTHGSGAGGAGPGIQFLSH